MQKDEDALNAIYERVTNSSDESFEIFAKCIML